MKSGYHMLPLCALIAFIFLWGGQILVSGTKGSPGADAENGHALFGDISVSATALQSAREDRLVAYWDFNEGEGVTLVDRSGQHNGGVIHGDPEWVLGKDSLALHFDGVKDYVLLSDSADLDLATSFTIAAWVKPDEQNGGVVLSKNGFSQSNKGGYAFALRGASVGYELHRTSGLSSTHPAVLPEAWVHVAVVYNAIDSPNTRLFINGSHVVSGDIPTPEKNSEDLLIARNNTNGYFQGSVDEVRFYKRSLSETEMRDLYRSYDSGEGNASQNISRGIFSELLTPLFQNMDVMAGVLSALRVSP